MDIPAGNQKKEFWQQHIKQFADFRGSRRKYAEQNGLGLYPFAVMVEILSKINQATTIEDYESLAKLLVKEPPCIKSAVNHGAVSSLTIDYT